jgi:glycosyltransferase involved in cell wall biosynthesis
MSYEKNFTNATSPHILMITNHGTHEWIITPGLTDTGGQNIFVNQFTDYLATCGFRITIVNRGGYPHPITGKLQTGVVYKDHVRRILYIEDSNKEFVRKEDMHESIPDLIGALRKFMSAERTNPVMIISHYWDAGILAAVLMKSMNMQIPHVWIPHSLGKIKKQKLNEQENRLLRMSERVEAEKQLLSELGFVVSTSKLVENSLRRDYDFMGKILFIPPCIETDRYTPMKLEDNHPVWNLLTKNLLGQKRDLTNSLIITEISRTDRTKRKDILIKAFAEIAEKYRSSLLVLTINQHNKKLAGKLLSLIHFYGIENQTVVLGSVWEWLPFLYSITDIYCSPSAMEGFGMSIQEAAACRTAIVASNLIPFAVEYLVGQNEASTNDGAIIVPVDEVQNFSEALELLLSNRELRDSMAESAYNRTIPQFTWNKVVDEFLHDMNMTRSGEVS